MRLLLTGASSFSGYWFAEKLQAAGFEISAPLKRTLAEYTGLRGQRVKKLHRVAEVLDECPFGSERFLELVDGANFDILCHHAARVTDYRGIDFDVTAALAENTQNLPAVLKRMRERGLRAVVFTGTVFEPDEGVGSLPLRGFSPYGLSKGLTAQVFRHWCMHFDVPFGKFIIANPFGPFEEARFSAYLMKTWQSGQVAEVRTPSYIRDNIHVDLLALAYVHFVRRIVQTKGSERFGPIGYVETQGAFTLRYAREIKARLKLDCAVKLLEQIDFSEPLVRINTHRVAVCGLGWSECDAWDKLADYYAHPALIDNNAS